MKGLLILFMIFPVFMLAQTVSNTYSAGDIPTSLPPFNPTCNGPVTTLSVNLPSGGPWVVTGISIEYDMLAQSTGWKSHQRSQIYCQTTNKNEPSVYAGTGDENGVQSYLRSNVAIANGTYAGGTSLVFEMKAMRTMEGTGCNTTYNRVNNFTWTITVYYTMYTETGSVGIGTSSPDSSALIDLSSATKGLLPPRMNTGLRLAIEEPAAGLVVYDTDVDKLFCYTGSSWIQLWSDFTSMLRDADNDTKLQVEESPDEDKIRFDLEGVERWVMEDSRLEPKNTGHSVFIGEDAGLNDDLSVNKNIGIGHQTLFSNTNATENIAIGYQSMYSNGSASNIAIGSQSMYSGVGNFNIGIGIQTLSVNNGLSNIAIGHSALFKNTEGIGNIGIGSSALYENLTSDRNVAIGSSALTENVSGEENTAVGHSALQGNAIGSQNVAIGYNSGEGYFTTDFEQCTFIGSNSTATVPRANITMLGYGIYNSQCTGDDQIMLGNTAITSIRAQVTSITAYSDARYKTNVIEDIKGLDFIRRLRPVSYNVRPTELHKIWGTPDSLYQRIDHSGIEKMRFSGFLAQEVEQAANASNYSFTGIDIPKNEKETYALRYTEFIIPMVKAIQEQQTLIEQLQSTNEYLVQVNGELEEKYLVLEERLNQLIISVASQQK